MTPPNADHRRRINRNSADIDAIYEIVSAHDLRFDQIDARFDHVDARFEQVDARFEQVDEALAEILRRLPEPPAA